MAISNKILDKKTKNVNTTKILITKSNNNKNPLINKIKNDLDYIDNIINKKNYISNDKIDNTNYKIVNNLNDIKNIKSNNNIIHFKSIRYFKINKNIENINNKIDNIINNNNLNNNPNNKY